MTSLEKLLLNLETEINKDTTLDRQMRELHLVCHVVVLVYHVIQQVLIVLVVRRGIISRG